MVMLDSDSDRYARERAEMVERQLRARGIRDQRVLDAMSRIPRHEFVPEEFRSQAYQDHPVPIGENQTISQPFIIALSLQALDLAGTEMVLEVGTGSGYQTAVVAELAGLVYTIERYSRLAENAEQILARLGFANVRVAVGDGSLGLREHAPYEAIVVSAAAPSLPRSLFDQLADSGRMVIPIGPPHAQELELVRKQQGEPVIKVLEGCRFVPLIGGEGY
ncbi:MAG: protein-L-isoaspartate(D-aspartate) O-methyltransferase [Acidobacteria bacterium]|nr:protein-L-isoaspartate(D-aspartate) O-methyltransferase [Acidobacteriota bacterium]